jgi:flavodoxin
MKAAILYWSKSGNTEKVALAIKEGLEAAGAQVDCLKTGEAAGIDYFAYDLVCVGFPSYQWHVPEPVDAFLKKKHAGYRDQGRIKLASPTLPGKYALIFCTYSGPHTGINEATPAGKYAGQFFEHLGFTILDEWYILGEFHGKIDNSTKGRAGDVRGLPSVDDLKRIKQAAVNLLTRIPETAER